MFSNSFVQKLFAEPNLSEEGGYKPSKEHIGMNGQKNKALLSLEF